MTQIKRRMLISRTDNGLTKSWKGETPFGLRPNQGATAIEKISQEAKKKRRRARSGGNRAPAARAFLVCHEPGESGRRQHKRSRNGYRDDRERGKKDHASEEQRLTHPFHHRLPRGLNLGSLSDCIWNGLFHRTPTTRLYSCIRSKSGPEVQRLTQPLRPGLRRNRLISAHTHY